jgi:hypothetical protein
MIGGIAMSRLRAYVAVFLILTAVAGVAYWWNADWWAYYNPGGEGWKPKFQMPVWWQVIESAFVGSLASAAVTFSIVAVGQAVLWLRRGRTPPSQSVFAN